MYVPYDRWHSVHRTKADIGDKTKKTMTDDKTKKTMIADYKLRTLSATGLKRLWKRYVACNFDAENPKCKHLNEDYDNVFDTWLGKQNYTIKRTPKPNEHKNARDFIEKCIGKNCKEIKDDDDYTYYRLNDEAREKYRRSDGGTRRRVKRTKTRRIK